MAHGVVADEEDGLIYVMGGSAKASADFGPGLDEMEILKVCTIIVLLQLINYFGHYL